MVSNLYSICSPQASLPFFLLDFVVIKLVILDRDGVINHDSSDFIKSPDEWIPIQGSLEAIAALKAHGWTVAVATNQSGIARGLFEVCMLEAIHQAMHEALACHQAAVDFVVFCPHGPGDGCDCRKPKTGLYKQISTHFGCSLQSIPVIGDSARDLEAAVAVGAQPILVKTGKGHKTIASRQLPLGTIVYDDLQSAVAALLVAET